MMKVRYAGKPGHRCVTATLAAVLALPVTPCGAGEDVSSSGSAGLSVEVRTEPENVVLTRGDTVIVRFRTGTGAYVMILRADTDGRISILYPTHPNDAAAVSGVSHRVIQQGTGYSFAVDDYPGEGYLFALATHEPLSLGGLTTGDLWDYALLPNRGRVVGDPYLALAELAELLAPTGAAFAFDVLSYPVASHFEYPRFLCYDCHTFVDFPSWNPYATACPRFRIVAYDDVHRHGDEHYGADRVVLPPRTGSGIAPRFVFRDRRFGDRYLTRVSIGADATGRRLVDIGITSERFGGVGLVAAPGFPGTGQNIAPETPNVPRAPLNPAQQRPTLERRDPRHEPDPNAGPIPRRVPDASPSRER